jgi:PAS domain S-box-containing protein/putative nucleotidyltransferase with HDIG domain
VKDFITRYYNLIMGALLAIFIVGGIASTLAQHRLNRQVERHVALFDSLQSAEAALMQSHIALYDMLSGESPQDSSLLSTNLQNLSSYTKLLDKPVLVKLIRVYSQYSNQRLIDKSEQLHFAFHQAYEQLKQSFNAIHLAELSKIKQIERHLAYVANITALGVLLLGLIIFFFTLIYAKSRNKLYAESKRLRDIIENTQDFVGMLDMNGKTLYVNPAGHRLMGYGSDEDMTGLSMGDYHDKKTCEYLKKVGLPFATKHGAWESETDFKNKKGRFVPTSQVLIAHKDSQGQTRCFSTIVRDISQNQMRSGLLKQAIAAIADMVEQRDPYTAGHQERVANLAAAIAGEMGLSKRQLLGLELAALIHDIGKIHIPSEILNKPGKLTALEFEIVRTHPKVGADVLSNLHTDWPIAEIVLQHHERLDGSGYPNQLKGDDILLEAKIIAVADVYDAMTTHRPYRPAIGSKEAKEELKKNKGKLYDADVVDVCLKVVSKE